MAEEKRLREKHRELEQERKIAELQQMKEEAGYGKRSTQKLDWMYQYGVVQQPSTEEYLFGGKRAQLPDEPAEDTTTLGLFKNKEATIAQDSWSKLRGDPLLMIKKMEQAARRQITQNPIKMESLRKEVKKQKREKKRKRKEKGSKKNKKSRSVSRSPDDANRRKSKKSRRPRSVSRSPDGAAHNRNHREYKRTRSASRSPQYDANRMNYKRSKGSRSISRSPDTARNRKSKDDEKSRSTRSSPEDGVHKKVSKASSTTGFGLTFPSGFKAPQPVIDPKDVEVPEEEEEKRYVRKRPKPLNLPEEERKARLEEMMNDAAVHQQRKIRRREQEEEEESREMQARLRADTDIDPSFLSSIKKKAYPEHGVTLGDRLKRNVHYIQKHGLENAGIFKDQS